MVSSFYLPGAATTGSLRLLFTSLCLQWQYVCLIVRMYVVQGVYEVKWSGGV
jgi:hypothetical protein